MLNNDLQTKGLEMETAWVVTYSLLTTASILVLTCLFWDSGNKAIRVGAGIFCTVLLGTDILVDFLQHHPWRTAAKWITLVACLLILSMKKSPQHRGLWQMLDGGARGGICLITSTILLVLGTALLTKGYLQEETLNKIVGMILAIGSALSRLQAQHEFTPHLFPKQRETAPLQQTSQEQRATS